MLANLPVTTLNLSDMVQARIEYIYAEPYAQSPMIETGTITAVKELKDGRLEMYVVPDNDKRMAKYRIAESHLLRYLHGEDTGVRAQIVA